MFEHILVPLDGSPLAESVLPHVVALSQVYKSRVTLLRVLEPGRVIRHPRIIDPVVWHMYKVESMAYLREMGVRLQQVGLRAERAILEGQLSESINQFVHEQGVDLVALSAHGESGLTRWGIGTAVQKILLQADVPTLIVRPRQPVVDDLTGLRYRKLLVPLDCSLRAECALPVAATLAASHEAQLLLAHVIRRPQMPRRVPLTQEETELAERLVEYNRKAAARYFEELQHRMSWQVESRLVVSEYVSATLHELVAQQGIDLILLSAHGYSGESQWPFGSVALNLVWHGTASILLVQDLSRGQMERARGEKATREKKGH